jgi:nucleoside-diphosphate-sugar epimerase
LIKIAILIKANDMSKTVFLEGATGNLGFRILKNLRAQGAKVNCLIRPGASEAVRARLRDFATELREADISDDKSLAKACEGADVVVSAVAGLRPVMIDFQTRLVDAAVAAGVPRFIPSDFSIDFGEIPAGDNRNLSIRQEFCAFLDNHSKISATSVLNGAFMDMLTGTAPFILFPLKRILCWGDPNQLMDFTTIDNTAAFTAFAALDNDAPRYLRIAGEELSANKLAAIMTELSGKPYGILKPGGPKTLKAIITVLKTISPSNDVLYPAWQGMQYMQNMYDGKCKFESLDNSRYPVTFTNTKTLLAEFLQSQSAGGNHTSALP